MSTRPRLESTVLGLMDVGDQPASQFVLVVENLLGPRQAFSIDSFEVVENVVRGYLGFGSAKHVIIAIPRETAWGVINRELLTLRTIQEAARKSKLDQDALDAFGKELNPETETRTAPARDLTAPGFYV